MRMFWLCSSLSLLTFACSGGDSKDDVVDAGEGLADASSSGGIDAQAGLPSSCTGDCAEMNLIATFGATTRTFDRAFFGFTSPENSESGEWELYIENGAGTDDQCPTMQSPIPNYLLVIAGIPLATVDPGPVSVTANLIDFEGALLPSAPREEASATTITWSAYDPCLACAEGDEPDRASRMIAVEIESTFSGGNIAGHSYAVHCDSLDTI